MDAPKPIFKHTFQIKIENVSEDSSPEYFYAVEGLGLIYQTEQYLPGGYNQPFAIPTVYQTTNLILKRPLLVDKTEITKWCEETLDTGVFKPTVAHIFVLGRNEEVRVHWSAEGIYPLGFKLSSLDVEQGNSVIVETITLAYSRLSRVS